MSFLGSLFAGGWPSSLRAERFELLGQAYQQGGDFRNGYRAFLSAWRALSKSEDSWRVADTALRLGDMCRQQEKFREAIRWYATAEARAKHPKSDRIRLDATCGRAMAFRGLGLYRTALPIFSRLLRGYRRRRDKEGEAYILWAMGTTERFAGRLSDADRHLEMAVRLYARLGDASGLAYARCGWGGTLRMMGYASRSRRLYALGFRTFRQTGDRFGLAYSSCGQGNALRMMGRLSAARLFMKRAEKNYRALRLPGPLGFVLWSRAMLEAECHSWREASTKLRGAESQFRRVRDLRGLVYVLLGKGELARAQGKPSSTVFDQAARAARRLGLPFEESHARVRSAKASGAIYRRFGVSIPLFSRYRSFP